MNPDPPIDDQNDSDDTNESSKADARSNLLLATLSATSLVLFVAFVGGGLLWVNNLAKERAQLADKVVELNIEVDKTRGKTEQINVNIDKLQVAVTDMTKRLEDPLSARLKSLEDDLQKRPPTRISRLPIKISGNPAKDTVEPGEGLTAAHKENAPIDLSKAPDVVKDLEGETIVAVWYSPRDNLRDLAFFQSISVGHPMNKLTVTSTYTPEAQKMANPPTVQITAYILHRKN